MCAAVLCDHATRVPLVGRRPTTLSCRHLFKRQRIRILLIERQGFLSVAGGYNTPVWTRRSFGGFETHTVQCDPFDKSECASRS